MNSTASFMWLVPLLSTLAALVVAYQVWPRDYSSRNRVVMIARVLWATTIGLCSASIALLTWAWWFTH